jgi:hypothetical protein
MKLPWIGDPPPAVKDRPTCPWCSKPLRPWVDRIREKIPRPAMAAKGPYGVATPEGYNIGELVGQQWRTDIGDGYLGYGPFDKLDCARRFGLAAYKAGFRRKEQA